MRRYLLIALAWMAPSYPLYKYVSPVAVIIYGFGSLILFFIWVAARSKK